MEAATKKRRGRPSLHSDELKEGMAIMFPDVSERTLINLYFAARGHELAIDLLGKEEADRRFLNPNDNRYHGWRPYRYQGVLEQIGRMSLQDGFSDADCKDMMAAAIDLIDFDGFTSKKLEHLLRTQRRRARNRKKVAATENHE